MAKKSNSVSNVMDQIEDAYAKLPSLPKEFTKFLVMVAPWVALIGGIIVVLGSLTSFGILTVFSPFVMMGGGYSSTAFSLLSAALTLVMGVLLLVAFPGLKMNKMNGWNMLLWSNVVACISSLIVLSLGGVIWFVIALYFLYQMKPSYK